MTPRLARSGMLFVSLLLVCPTWLTAAPSHQVAVANDAEAVEQQLRAGDNLGDEHIKQEVDGLSDQLAARFFVTVFVTSQRYTGNLVKEANNLDPAPEPLFDDTQGLEAGDFICNIHANWGGHWGHFAAWLSTEEVNAKDRLTAGSGPFMAIDGTIIAESIPDLTDGTLQAQIVLDELGFPVVHPKVSGLPKEGVNSRWYRSTVWTGTRSDGTAQEGQNCNGWAHYEDTDDPSYATVGEVCDGCVGEWTLGGSLGCNWRTRSHLYCFRVRSDPDPGSSS